MSVVDRALLRLLENERQAQGTSTGETSSPASNPSPTEKNQNGLTDRDASRHRSAHTAHDNRDRSMHVKIPSSMNTSMPDVTDEAREAAGQGDDVETGGPNVQGERRSRRRPTARPQEPASDPVTAPDTEPVFVPVNIRFDTAHAWHAASARNAESKVIGEPDTGPSVVSVDVQHESQSESLGSATDVDRDVTGDSESDNDASIPTVPTQQVNEFKPAFEVDRFAWSPFCSSLLDIKRFDFERAARHLLKVATPGCNVIGVTRLDNTRGSSTVTLCLARTLAAMDASVLIADANFSNPTLALSLNIANSFGWNSDFDHADDIADALITSVDDSVVLAPGPNATNHLPPNSTARLGKSLSRPFAATLT